MRVNKKTAAGAEEEEEWAGEVKVTRLLLGVQMGRASGVPLILRVLILASAPLLRVHQCHCNA